MNNFQRHFCERILEKLEKRPICKFFLEVNPAALEKPIYEKNPKDAYDLACVKRRLNSGYYKTVNEWAIDVRKVWKSRPKNDIERHYDNIAEELSKYFEKKWNDYPRSERELWTQEMDKLRKKVVKISDSMPIWKDLIMTTRKEEEQIKGEGQ